MVRSKELKEGRRLREWSRPRLAKLAGCSPESILRYEEGRNCPDKRWANILGVFATHRAGLMVDSAEISEVHPVKGENRKKSNGLISHKPARSAEQKNDLVALDGGSIQTGGSLAGERPTPMQRIEIIQKLTQETNENIKLLVEMMRQFFDAQGIQKQAEKKAKRKVG